jgi:hypothetical protein
MRRPLGQLTWAETPVAARAAMKTEVKLTILMDCGLRLRSWCLYVVEWME